MVINMAKDFEFGFSPNVIIGDLLGKYSLHRIDNIFDQELFATENKQFGFNSFLDMFNDTESLAKKPEENTPKTPELTGDHGPTLPKSSIKRPFSLQSAHENPPKRIKLVPGLMKTPGPPKAKLFSSEKKPVGAPEPRFKCFEEEKAEVESLLARIPNPLPPLPVVSFSLQEQYLLTKLSLLSLKQTQVTLIHSLLP